MAKKTQKTECKGQATLFTGTVQKGWLELEVYADDDTTPTSVTAAVDPLGWQLSSRQRTWEADKTLKHVGYVRKELDRHPWTRAELTAIKKSLEAVLTPLNVVFVTHRGNGLD